MVKILKLRYCTDTDIKKHPALHVKTTKVLFLRIKNKVILQFTNCSLTQNTSFWLPKRKTAYISPTLMRASVLLT